MTTRLSTLAALAFALPVGAQEGVEAVTDIEEVSLEDLLETDTTVASSKSVQLRASPGVVTVVGREEIQRLGARDLLDLLPLVPGFDVGVDVTSVVGLSFRGNWAHEGKLLIMVDGVEMNEVLYQTSPVGGRFPLHDVERVEILRGPGSARYGGFAALAVINLVTRTGAQKSGVDVGATYAQNVTPFANQTLNASAGQQLDVLGGLDLSVHAQVSERQRSDRDYVDVFGDTWQMAGRSPLSNVWLNASAKTPWLKTRLLVDIYGVRGRDGYDAVLPTEALEGFPSFALDVQAPLALHPTLTVTPKLVLLRQLPWWSFEEDTPDILPARTVLDRGRLGVDVAWQPIPTIAISAGAEGYVDAAREVPQGSQPAALDFVDMRLLGDDVTNFINGAVYGDAQIETGLFTLTVGSRAELHSTYGPSAVPRVALTRVFPTGHLKLLVSGAFKAPSIVNLQVNPDIRPERTRVLEGEAGLQVVDGVYVPSTSPSTTPSSTSSIPRPTTRATPTSIAPAPAASRASCATPAASSISAPATPSPLPPGSTMSPATASPASPRACWACRTTSWSLARRSTSATT